MAAYRDPLHVFRFRVDFSEAGTQTQVELCSGLFSECSGLEATMEPKGIREGGRNWGEAQLPGPVTFSTVILKRGITTTRHLWQWFQMVNAAEKFAQRLDAKITLYGELDKETSTAQKPKYKPKLRWRLHNALPVKFKSPDLNAKGSEVGIEELHIVHEGFFLEQVEGQ